MSLKKSHSKISNFKLTLLSLFASTCSSLTFIFLGLLDKNFNLYIIFVSIFGIGSLISLFLFNMFKR